MACGSLITLELIEEPGLFYVFIDESGSTRFGTAFNANAKLPERTLLYHATYTDTLKVIYISEEYKVLIAEGDLEETVIEALLQGN
jgi:hypothetical protein